MKFNYPSDPNEALFEAVNRGSHSDVIEFLTRGKTPADPNWVHPTQLVKNGGANHSILHRAAYLEGQSDIGMRGNQMHITLAILDNAVIPINPDLKDRQGNTALHLLAESTKNMAAFSGAQAGNVRAFERMFELGFDPALSNNRCATPFSMLSPQSTQIIKCFQAHFYKKEQQERKAKKVEGVNEMGKRLMQKVDAALKKKEAPTTKNKKKKEGKIKKAKNEKKKKTVKAVKKTVKAGKKNT